MSYSRRQLYAMGETFGDSATRREVGGRIVYGGGGGKSAPAPTTTITESGPSTTTLNRTTLNEIPTYLTDASRDLVTRGQELSRTPFEAYGGPRVAEFSPDMQSAFSRMRNQGVAGQTTEASGLASLAGQRAMDYGQFQTGVQQYMNPYIQNVVDIERRKAQRVADEQSAALSGQAARQGAFGGSGAALQQRALTRDTAQQLADIQAQGLDRAYQSAVGQYNQGITGGLAAASQLGGLGQQQFGQEMDITQGLGTAGDVQRQREQALLDVGYGDFLAAKKDPFEKLAFQQGLVSGVPYSTTQRVTGQEVTQPGKTVSQMTATPPAGPNPASQALGTGLALYGASRGEGGGGISGGGYNSSAGYTGGNATVGGPIGSPDVRGTPFNAKGGEVKRYAVGGIAALNQPEMASAVQGMSDPQVQGVAAMPGLPGLTGGGEQVRRDAIRMAAEGQQASSSMNKLTTTLSQMSDAELQQYAKLNKNDPYTMALVVAEADRRKEGGMPAQEAPTVVAQQIASMALPEETGIAQLPVGNMDFAGGGIIAFQNRGAVPNPDMLEEEERLRKEAELQVGIGALPLYTMPTGMTPEMAAASGVPTGVQELMRQRRTLVGETGQQGIRAAEANLAGIQEDLAEMGPIGAERDKRNLAQEKELESAEGKNFNMALIQAGLAIMAGNSANAFENIGKGALIGTEAYTKGMERIQNRKEKLDESIARLDELRYSTKKEDKAAVRSAMNGVNTAKTALGNALAGVLGEEGKIAADAYAGQETRKATYASANKPTDMRNYAADVLAASKGDKEAQIRVDAVNKYLAYQGAAAQRADIAETQAGTASDVAEFNRRKEAREKTEEAISVLGDRKTRKEYSDLVKLDRKDGGNRAEEYKAQLFDKVLAGLTPTSTAPAPAPSAAPAAASASAAPNIASVTGAPRGATIGAQTAKGWEVKDRSGKVIGYAQP